MSQIQTSKSKRSVDTNRRPSDPRRAKTLHLREVRIIRHNTAPETEGGGSNHTIRHGDVPMDALEEPGVPRQPDVERHHLEPRVLKGSQLGEGLLSAPFPTDRIGHLRDHDGRKDAAPFPAERGELGPCSREDLFVVRGVVSDEESGIQDLLQSSSSRDSSRIFSIRSDVVVFDRKPPRSSRRATGRRTIESPRSSTTSRLPCSIRCRLRNSIGIVVWPLRVTLMTLRARSMLLTRSLMCDKCSYQEDESYLFRNPISSDTLAQRDRCHRPEGVLSGRWVFSVQGIA